MVKQGMTIARQIAVVVLAMQLVILPGSTNGASPHEPTITDEPGPVDVDSNLGIVYVEIPPVDIRWVDAQIMNPGISVTWAVEDLDTAGLNETSRLHFFFTFRSQEYALGSVHAIFLGPGRDDPWKCFFTGHRHNGSVRSEEIGVEVDYSTNLVACNLANIPQTFPLTNTRASSVLLFKTGQGGFSLFLVWFRDRAPNTGFGQNVDPR